MRALIERGDLPNLASLLDEGTWGSVDSPARIASGSVWPTFSTGLSPLEHGIHSFWAWDAAAMRLVPVSVGHLRPFWMELARQGFRAGVVDVPFTPPIGLSSGVEVFGWGAHDCVTRKTEVFPVALAGLVQQAAGSHPFSEKPLHIWVKNDDEQAFAAACVRGVRQRGDLLTALVARLELDLLVAVFSEVHRGSHVLWRTADPNHPLHAASAARGEGSWLLDVYRETDRQIGRLVDAVASPATLVFSLHGMRPLLGIPTVLGGLLEAAGLSALRTGPAGTMRSRARRAFGGARRLIPAPLKRLYHRVLPPEATSRLAYEGFPSYDWSRTVAFPLDSDQHGWVRINLAGREALGIVPPEGYEAARDDVEQTLRTARTEAGASIVDDVVRPPHDPFSPPFSALPDLVVNWAETAAAAPLRLAQLDLITWPEATNLSGQHTYEGFFLMHPRGADGLSADQRIDAANLHHVISGLVRERR